MCKHPWVLAEEGFTHLRNFLLDEEAPNGIFVLLVVFLLSPFVCSCVVSFLSLNCWLLCFKFCPFQVRLLEASVAAGPRGETLSSGRPPAASPGVPTA